MNKFRNIIKTINEGVSKMKTSMLVSLIVATASIAMADVLLPDTSTIADIQVAIDNAQPGEVIILADGTYTFNQTLYVRNGVTLTGSGRDACILSGDDSLPLSTALIIDHADACVKSLTVSNIIAASAYNFTGVGVQVKSGRLSQARVTACKALTSKNTLNRTAGVSLEGANAVMTHCLIDHNEGTATACIGGVRIHYGGGTMANCIIWANTGVNAGGISLKPNPWVSPKIVNCTIVANTATTRGGGLANEADAQYLWSNIDNSFCGPEIVNTIISGNVAPNGADFYFGFSDEAARNATFHSCLCPTMTYGFNTQSVDPLFDVSVETGDFHLQSGSSARNAGDLSKAESVLGYTLAETQDFYGLERVLEDSIEIGCAEFDPSLVACSIVKSKDLYFVGETVSLSAVVSGFDGASDVVYSWKITQDGVVVPVAGTGAAVELEASLTGHYTVELAVSSEQLQRSIVATPVTFGIIKKVVYVTSAANPECKYPYADLRTAATNLNEALTAAVEGMVVELDEGVHPVFETVSIPKGVMVKGAGRDKTTISAAKKFNIVVKINGKGAFLTDVTIAHGRMGASWIEEPSGVLIGENGGTMADCRVTDCSNDGCWRAYGVVKMTGRDAVLTRCLIDGNSMIDGNSSGQSPSGVYATAGRIENCVITNNIGHAYGGANVPGLYLGGSVVALNCTVLGNRMQNGYSGGGVQAANTSAVVRNCIIDGNFSGDGSEVNYFGNGSSFSYCLSSDAAPEGSEGCLVARPVFDAKKPLYLAKRTPGKSQGCAAGYEDLLLNGTDFFGQPRVKHISRTGVADIDIGATESQHFPNGFSIYLR